MPEHIAFALALIHECQRGETLERACRGLRKRGGGPEGAALRDSIWLTRLYFRWRGILKDASVAPRALDECRDLDRSFHANPKQFNHAILLRTLPRWAREMMPWTTQQLRALQTTPDTWLRLRSMDLTQVRSFPTQSFSEWLQARENAADPAILKAGKNLEPLLATTVRYLGDDDLARSLPFENGEFEIQDISSQIVGAICNAQPKSKWWDVCAGEGGKTLHLAECMRGSGVVWATDRAAWRLARLKRRAARAQVFNLRIAGPELKKNAGKFDGVLVDAPCSGIGVWGKHPESKWRLNPQDIQELSEVQFELLTNGAPYVRNGGRLIYSVCTLSPEETENVARRFSQAFPDFKPVSMPACDAPDWKIWPDQFAGAGMYIASWKRE